MSKLVFGDVDPAARKKRQVRKTEKPPAPPTPEKRCAFQVLEEVPWERLMRSAQCKEPALSNGWCKEHQHAQTGMEIGEQLGWQSVEIPMCAYYGDENVRQFTLIIGQGRANWLAYFERAREPGLTTVMKYLEKKQVEREF